MHVFVRACIPARACVQTCLNACVRGAPLAPGPWLVAKLPINTLRTETCEGVWGALPSFARSEFETSRSQPAPTLGAVTGVFLERLKQLCVLSVGECGWRWIAALMRLEQ
eukprot:6191468-Alexandrium_andersonii.AAC.1